MYCLIYPRVLNSSQCSLYSLKGRVLSFLEMLIYLPFCTKKELKNRKMRPNVRPKSHGMDQRQFKFNNKTFFRAFLTTI